MGVAFGMTGALAGPAAAQSGPWCEVGEVRTVVDHTEPNVRPPFTVGERLEYSVSFGHLHVGSGAMEVTARDTVRGFPVWRARLAISGGIPMLHVNDTTTSWFDSTTFDSRRFAKQLHEPRYHANRDTQIFQERHTYQELGKSEMPSVPNALDDVSLVYFVRTLPLVPGHCYEVRRYYKANANPVIIHVLRRESIDVPAGHYDAIVVRPAIRTDGIFSQNGEAELWLSDDSSRLLLQLKSQLPFGSINLYLTHATPGP